MQMWLIIDDMCCCVGGGAFGEKKMKQVLRFFVLLTAKSAFWVCMCVYNIEKPEQK